MNPSQVRALFPGLKERAYLIVGAVAPVNTRSREALQRHLDSLTNDAVNLYYHALDEAKEVKRLFARLMHAEALEIAITESCSAASNIAVDLLDPTPGGNVVFDEFTYPSSIYPWLLPPRDHLEKRFVKPKDGLIRLEDMAEAIDDKTIAVSVTHVSPFEGFKHDLAQLAQIAHAHGALLLVDGSQAAGAMEINLHQAGVDFYATCAMKWLLGAAGVGFLYVAKKHLDKKPSRAGYIAAGGFNAHDFSLVPSAERLELGMPNLMGLAYTRPGLEILLEIGLDKVEKHVLDLAGYCLAGMKERGLNVLTPEAPEHRLGVIAAWFEEAVALNRFLLERGVETCTLSLKTNIPYPGSPFRVDPHVYNNREDIDRLLEGIDAFYAKG